MTWYENSMGSPNVPTLIDVERSLTKQVEEVASIMRHCNCRGQNEIKDLLFPRSPGRGDAALDRAKATQREKARNTCTSTTAGVRVLSSTRTRAVTEY